MKNAVTKRVGRRKFYREIPLHRVQMLRGMNGNRLKMASEQRGGTGLLQINGNPAMGTAHYSGEVSGAPYEVLSVKAGRREVVTRDNSSSLILRNWRRLF